MNGLSQARFSKGSVFFIGISLILLALIVGLGILPARTETDHLKAKIRNLEAKLEEQKIFTPLHLSLSQKLNQKSELEIEIEGVTPYRKPLLVDNAAEALLSMATAAGLVESYFVPVPTSVTKDATRLLVEGRLQGEYHCFRNFMMTLSAWPDFDHLELLEIESQPHEPHYKIRVWLSLVQT